MQDNHLISSQGERTLAFWEIVSVVLSCLIAEWVVLSLLNRHRWVIVIPILLAVAFMSVSHKIYGENLRSLGFRTDNLIAALRLLLLPTLVAAAVVFIVGWFWSGPPTSGRILRPRLTLLPLWALFQQYALQGFINRRAQLVFGRGVRSVVLVALVFSLIHLPNLILSSLTLIGGLIWAAVYQRQPNLFALAASHTVASVSLAIALPLNVINGLRVGFKYFG